MRTTNEFIAGSMVAAQEIKKSYPASLTAGILEEWAAEEIREKLSKKKEVPKYTNK